MRGLRFLFLVVIASLVLGAHRLAFARPGREAKGTMFVRAFSDNLGHSMKDLSAGVRHYDLRMRLRRRSVDGSTVIRCRDLPNAKARRCLRSGPYALSDTIQCIGVEELTLRNYGGSRLYIPATLRLLSKCPSGWTSFHVFTGKVRIR